MNEEFGVEPQKQSNTLGLIGFILAFCVSPIGLLVSLIALAKPPRGFAIGGVAVGLLGSVLWGLFGWGIYLGIDITAKGVEGYADLSAVRSAMSQQSDATDLSTLGLSEDQTLDPWGNPYRLDTQDAEWSLTSAGKDGALDTKDDVVIRQNMTEEEVIQAFADAFAASMGAQP